MAPYSILFPIGLLTGMAGVGLWLFHRFGLVSRYPGTLHAELMTGGFLFTFAMGFLMTAVPRFTGAAPASRYEKIAAAILAALMPVMAVTAFHSWTWTFLAATFLIAFSARRFLARRFDPPPTFAFVGLGLGLGWLGAGLLAFTEFPAQGLYYHGMMTCLVLGVGGRLIPAITGWAASPVTWVNDPRGVQAGSRGWVLHVLVGTFALSFLVEAALPPSVGPQAGAALRAAAASGVAIGYWRLHRRPLTAGALPFWLWISAWSFLLGLWGTAAFPGYRVHAAHLTFVAGYGLMILLVATRVTLAHGGFGRRLESSSRVLRWTAILIVTAAVTRAMAPLGTGYFNHLAYAAAAWIIALCLWSSVFVPKLLIRERTHD